MPIVHDLLDLVIESKVQVVRIPLSYLSLSMAFLASIQPLTCSKDLPDLF